MPSLTVLDLSSNVIGVLKRQSLQGLPKLTTLKIARNELTRVGEDTFKDSQQVKHLDLGGNRFQALEQVCTDSHVHVVNMTDPTAQSCNMGCFSFSPEHIQGSVRPAIAQPIR